MCDLSIVLPSYNGEKYLEESINSIRSQTLTDWELILIDDCSVDSTLSIMKKFARMDDRIKIIHNNKNMNLPNSLNIGFRQAKGKYLTWTSDDNLYFNDAFKKMVCFLESNNDVYMVCTDMVYIDEKGKYIKDAPVYEENKFWYDNNVGASFMYRREVLTEIGEYSSILFGVEDYDYWIRVRKKYGKINRLSEKLYSYRIHKGSLSNTMFYQNKEKLNRIRNDNWQQITENIHDEAFLMSIWFDFILSGYNMEEYKTQIIIDEIQFYKEFNPYNHKIMIYGAGNYGEFAIKMLGNNVIGFIDSDMTKVGKEYQGKKIYSIDDAEKQFLGCQIVVAVDSLKLYEIAKMYSERKKLIMTTFHQMVSSKRKNL